MWECKCGTLGEEHASLESSEDISVLEGWIKTVCDYNISGSWRPGYLLVCAVVGNQEDLESCIDNALQQHSVVSVWTIVAHVGKVLIL